MNSPSLSFLTSFVSRAVALTALALLAIPSLHAQATGTVEGRVLNIGNGKYMSNVTVTVEGTNISELSNDIGEFRLYNVPAGNVKLTASVSGLDPQTSVVKVTAGQVARSDFNLTSAERYGEEKTITLDTFKVSTNREFEGNAIATNEQRFAKGLKVVMAADAFGDVTEGNAGEFLKYLPGVSVDYVAADVRTVSVRGFASNFTNVYLDGMPITSSNSGAAGRQFEFEQLSINNAARVEVLKVPTPDTPANGIGGNVNMVSKSAFERKGAQFNYRAYMSMNNEDISLKKTPGPASESTYKILPGFDFDYTLPLNDRFGLIVTGLSSNQFNEQHRMQTLWNFQQGGGTVLSPMLQTRQIQDGPKNTYRKSMSIKGDWKVADNQRLSVMVQDSYYESFFGNRNLNFDIGTTTTGANGSVLSFGQDFSQSPTGAFSATDPYGNRGRMTQGSSYRNKFGNTAAGNARYTYTGSLWNVEGGIHGAESRTWYRALGREHFSNVGTRMVGVANLRVDGVDFPYSTVVAKNTAGAEINQYDLTNYRLTTATDDPIDGLAKLAGAYVDVKRDFEVANIPLAVKVGSRVYEESKDNRRRSATYTFVGADGVANTADDSAAPYLDTSYYGVNPYWGSKPIQWVDAYKLRNALVTNPSYFTRNLVAEEQSRILNSEKITETITAGYVQFEAKFLNNKLQIVTGVRYEKTKDLGEGQLQLGNDVLFEKDATGKLIDGNPTLAGIQYVRKAAAGPAGAPTTTNTQTPSGTFGSNPLTYTTTTLQELSLTTFERGAKPERNYDGYYPSLNITYNVTPNLLVRVGYAKTMGRPDYTFIIPRTVIDDNENFDPTNPNQTPGSLTIRNTGLQPWTADNYDLSVEYYFGKGGVLSGGIFQKNIADFFSTRSGTVDAALAKELGISDEFIGWAVSTTVNGTGTAKIKGAEFNFNRNLDFLPGWGRYFTFYANATHLDLQGSNAADFANFIANTGNAGISFNKRPLSAKINVNYRGRQLRSALTAVQYGAANGFYEYFQARVNVDVNVEYTFSKRVKLFASARNIFNVPQILERTNNSQTPRYATIYQQEEFGVQIAAGIKGTF